MFFFSFPASVTLAVAHLAHHPRSAARHEEGAPASRSPEQDPRGGGPRRASAVPQDDASCVPPRTALRASFLPRSRPAQRGAARLISGPASPARRRKTPKQPAAMRTLKHPAATSPNPLSKHPRIAGVCVFLFFPGQRDAGRCPFSPSPTPGGPARRRSPSLKEHRTGPARRGPRRASAVPQDGFTTKHQALSYICKLGYDENGVQIFERAPSPYRTPPTSWRPTDTLNVRGVIDIPRRPLP